MSASEEQAIDPLGQTNAPAATKVKRPNIIRRMYRWVLHWADTPYGTPALCLISFAESSFFPIPPDVLQIALSYAHPKRAYYYAGVSALASVLGGIFGWVIGYALWESLQGFFYSYVPGVTPERIEFVGGKYHDNAFLAIFGAAFTPIPFKVFTIAAGVFHEYVSLQTLILASLLGRSGRFFLVAVAIRLLGPKFKDVLEKYVEVATLILFLLVVLGFWMLGSMSD